MIIDDLAEVGSRLQRHSILLGRRDNGEEEWVAPYGVNILVAGTSGSGKSTLATGLVGAAGRRGISSLAVIDPEETMRIWEAVPPCWATPKQAPAVKEVLDLLELPRQSVVVNLLGIELEHRPAFFQTLLPHLQELRPDRSAPLDRR